MNISEFLENEIFSFPSKASSYFPEHLSNIFTKYIELLKSVDDENSAIILKHFSDIENSCQVIQDITISFFEGKLSKSYESFSKIIKHFETYLLPKDRNVQIGGQTAYFFKARPILNKNFDLVDMFHIPFESRYIAKTNRFSITGLPCLYLSNSIYTCWEELDRPPFAQMAVSRFETHGRYFRYLDLSMKLRVLKNTFSVDWVKEEEKHTPNLVGVAADMHLARSMHLEAFIQLYPLYIACYTAVYRKDADFKPEYIFPQMLMQWVADSDYVDGITYESTKTEKLGMNRPPNLEDFLNYAIPVRSTSQNGFCNIIAKRIKLTKPTSWEIVNINDPTIASRNIDVKNDIIGKYPVPPIFNINLGGDKPTAYLQSAFGRFERILLNVPLHELI